jgi:hypothetical protein
LGPDTKSFSSVIANRQRTDFHGHVIRRRRTNRLCRQLQSSSPPLRSSVSKSFQIHAGQKEQFERRYLLKAQGYDIDRVVTKVSEVLQIEPAQVWKPGNQPLRVKARSLVCYWAVRELGLTGTIVGKLLGLGQPAVSRAVVRGEKLTQVMNLKLIK